MNEDTVILNTCKPYSLLSKERLQNNITSVRTVEWESIPGDIVEIGVYLGGSMMAMILAYESTKNHPRTFHMYDTFQGMTEASEYDTDNSGRTADDCMKRDPSVKCVAYLENVQENIRRNTQIVPKYHVGDILKNTYVPEKIAVLRLDTDWYESTKHELATFYENVVSGGFVIIDDYGHWKGCQKAVDEFLADHPDISLQKIDYTGVYFRKP